MGLWDALRRLLTAGTAEEDLDGAERSDATTTSTVQTFTAGLLPIRGDDSGTLTQELADAVGGYGGLVIKRIDGELGEAGDTEPSALTFGNAVRQGRHLMKQADCQVLIWADLIAPNCCRVRFIPRRIEGDMASGELLSGDLIDLPVPFGDTTDMALAGALAALHLPTDKERKQRLDRLRSSVSAVELLLQEPASFWPQGGKTKAGILYAIMLSEMGFRTGNTAILTRALDIIRTALGKDFGTNLMPALRAATLVHYGDLQTELGTKSQNTDALDFAVQAYRMATAFYTASDLPEEHANLMNQLGRALQYRSRISNKTSDMKEATQAYLAAAQVWTAGSRPNRWAELQYAVGTMLGQIAEFSGNKEAAERAVTFYTAATRIWSREKEPRRWANLMNNIGAVRFAQGKRSGDVPVLREAVECFSRALEIYQAAGMTRNVHVTQKNIARVERVITAQQGG
jgi:tetratricopeptide (TPR) repeat protein